MNFISLENDIKDLKKTINEAEIISPETLKDAEQCFDICVKMGKEITEFLACLTDGAVTMQKKIDAYREKLASQPAPSQAPTISLDDFDSEEPTEDEALEAELTKATQNTLF